MAINDCIPEEEIIQLIKFYQQNLTDLYRGEKITEILEKITEFYRNYKYLFSPEILNILDKDNFKLLLENYYLYHNYFAFFSIQSKKQSAKIKNFDNERILLYDILNILYLEKDRKKRQELLPKYTSKIQKINNVYCKMLIDYQLFLREYNFHNINEAYSYIHAYNQLDFKTEVENYLKKTKVEFITQIQYYLKLLFDIELEQANISDIWQIFRGNWLSDEHIRPNDVIFALNRIANKMNLIFSNHDNLIIDIESRNKKNAQAFIGFDWNEENERMYLVVNPNTGIFDLKSIVHEAGHAIHYANMSQSIPERYKIYGELEISETIAFLFESLLMSPSFLEKNFKLSPVWIKKYTDLLQFQRFYMKRFYCIKYLHQYQLFSQKNEYLKEDFEESQKYFESIFFENFGFHREGYDCFQIDDKIFGNIFYLRAFFMVPQLRELLSTKFSSSWWDNPAAGEFLKKNLFAFGFQKSFTQIFSDIGLNPHFFG